MELVDTILTEAGLVKNKTFKETRFTRPPASDFAVYTATTYRIGSDRTARLRQVDVNVRLLSKGPDSKFADSIESALDNHFGELLDGWSREEKVFYEDVQLYEVAYDFQYRYVTK